MTRGRVIAGGVVTLLALVAILVLSGPEQDSYRRPALDPRGTGPSGSAALVELLEATGAEVRLGGLPEADDDIVLMLSETLSGGAQDRLRRWAEDGGTVVVADPGAELAPRRDRSPGVLDQVVTEPGACTLDALADVETVDPGLEDVYDARTADATCFGTGQGVGAGLAVDRRDEGLVVGLSSPLVLLNESLDRADNAVLATALLVPFDGVQVRILDPNRFLGDEDEVGDGTVLGALPLRGRQAVTQMVIALVAVGLILGRRLGRPVTEELPVPLPASDLVLASGHLLDRNGAAADAAERLRRRARRGLGTDLGLGADPDPLALADALAARSAADPTLVHTALLAPVSDDAGLIRTSTAIDRLRRELSP